MKAAIAPAWRRLPGGLLSAVRPAAIRAAAAAAPMLIVPEFYTDILGVLIFLGALASQGLRVRAARARG